MNKPSFSCPVCGFSGLDDPAYDVHGYSTFEVCPCCGTEFGYDDASTSHEILRKQWIDKGMPWWSKRLPPPGWDPREQLTRMESEYLRRPDAQGHLKVLEMLRKWDPIAVITDENQDEYDSYAPDIVRLLDREVSVDDLIKVLENIQVDSMGLKPNKAKDQEIATHLVEWWKNWKAKK